ncbi:MAG: hypothetical protein ACU0CI_05535, partial [Shimia sp.]
MSDYTLGEVIASALLAATGAFGSSLMLTGEGPMMQPPGLAVYPARPTAEPRPADVPDQPVRLAEDPVDTEETPVPDVPPVPDPATAALPSGTPTFDVVRIDPDGEGLIAGATQPGATVTILLDGAPLQEAVADAAGKFVGFVSVPPATTSRVLTLTADLGEQLLTSDQSVIVEATPAADTRLVAAAPITGGATNRPPLEGVEGEGALTEEQIADLDAGSEAAAPMASANPPVVEAPASDAAEDRDVIALGSEAGGTVAPAPGPLESDTAESAAEASADAESARSSRAAEITDDDAGLGNNADIAALADEDAAVAPSAAERSNDEIADASASGDAPQDTANSATEPSSTPPLVTDRTGTPSAPTSSEIAAVQADTEQAVAASDESETAQTDTATGSERVETTRDAEGVGIARDIARVDPASGNEPADIASNAAQTETAGDAAQANTERAETANDAAQTGAVGDTTAGMTVSQQASAPTPPQA